MFIEGRDLYENASFKEKKHIQIAIRNHNCIKGFFIPIMPCYRFRLLLFPSPRITYTNPKKRNRMEKVRLLQGKWWMTALILFFCATTYAQVSKATYNTLYSEAISCKSEQLLSK